jgi:hypothetical protein
MSFISSRFASSNRSMSLNGIRELSDDDLRRSVPSAFALEPHESRSARYTYFPTHQVITGMREAGFVPVSATQGRSRIAGKADYTKHLIRFRPAGTEVAKRELGGLYPEIALLNSHDGTSTYQVMGGMLRLACLNGLLLADSEFASIKVPHKGDVTDQVIEASYEVIGESKRAIERAGEWATVKMNRDEQMVLADSVRTVRFADSEGEITTPIQADDLLVTRRREDTGNDLWTTVNVLQENAVRGNITAWGRDANGRRRRTTTREVRGIDGNTNLNKAIWALGEAMAKLKGA